MAEEFNPPPNTLAPPPAAPKTSRTLSLVLILAILSLTASGYLFWQNQKLQQQLEKLQKPAATLTTTSPILGSPQPTEITDLTAEWKTYTNTAYKYIVKYPQNYSVVENGMSGGDIQKATAVTFYQPGGDNYRSARFAVTRREDPDSFDNVVNKHFNKLTTNLLTEIERQNAAKNLGITVNPNQSAAPLTKITFLGYPAYQFSIAGSTVDDGASEFAVDSEIFKYLWINNNGYYLISYTNTKEMALIISTFKFTE